MSWLNLAFAFIFLCNLLFMVGAILALIRILDVVGKSSVDLQKAASNVIEMGAQTRLMVRHAFNEMERNSDALDARADSNGRAVAELSFQVKNLQDQLKTSLARLVVPEAHAQNNAVQNATEPAKSRPKEVAMEHLKERYADLEQQLQQAQERAKVAERRAEANAVQIDDLQAQIKEQSFAKSMDKSSLHDQSGLIASQQEQIDALTSREKTLLARIEDMKQEFMRSDVEKNFIEDRFLQLDSAALDAAKASADILP
ncbi:MAG: hypothetical protein IPH35_10045 [Rhodoferax sp.]|nr:hypothetical protein [Rhodoferax sp.]